MLTGADPEIREGGHGIGKQHILLTVLGIVDHLKELGRVSTKVSTSSEPPSPPKRKCHCHASQSSKIL